MGVCVVGACHKRGRRPPRSVRRLSEGRTPGLAGLSAELEREAGTVDRDIGRRWREFDGSVSLGVIARPVGPLVPVAKLICEQIDAMTGDVDEVV